jgi:uncharacterized protein YdhG (YjbR/CyaY superfamily)
MKKRPTTHSEYIASAPKERQAKLREMRAILKKVAGRGAKEEMKWGSPVFSLHRILFAYDAFKTSVNFMPTPAAMKPFKKELSKFRTGKGSIMFTYDKPLPKALITKIAKFRVKELKEKDVRWM